MKIELQLRLLTVDEQASDAETQVLKLANDADVLEWREQIMASPRVELVFPQFTDGRAYSQAWLIRRRFGFVGDLRATGEVLADQLIQMARTGFSSAVLQEGVDLEDARRQLQRFQAFYQGDVMSGTPFSRDAGGSTDNGATSGEAG
jgi:uncharacterized protein (DUF934 family)